jgi:hypothetical protein
MSRTVATLPPGSRITDCISLGFIAEAFSVTALRVALADTRPRPAQPSLGEVQTLGEVQNEQLPSSPRTRQSLAADRHLQSDTDREVNRSPARGRIHLPGRL